MKNWFASDECERNGIDAVLTIDEAKKLAARGELVNRIVLTDEDQPIPIGGRGCIYLPKGSLYRTLWKALTTTKGR